MTNDKLGIRVWLSLAMTMFGSMMMAFAEGEHPAKLEPPELILIEGGEIVMGNPLKDSKEHFEDEPMVRVSVGTFKIAKYPVTASDFCLFLNSEEGKALDIKSLYAFDDTHDKQHQFSTIAIKDGQCVPRENALKSPVNRVTWIGAVRYCSWISKRFDRKFRLPSEAEWELAARGTNTRAWPWGNEEPSELRGYRWAQVPRNFDAPWEKPSVGSYPKGATPEGVHDLLGYMMGEWCLSKYSGPTKGEEATATKIEENDKETSRVVRGGLHKQYFFARSVHDLLFPDHRSIDGRVWTRLSEDPLIAPLRSARYGFRVVEEVPDEKGIPRE